MKHTFEEFKRDLKHLKDFFEEQKKLGELAKVISPSGTNVCEVGNKFIDAYIRLLEDKYEDENDWISWFVFENDFGDGGLAANIGTEWILIVDTQSFYYNIINKL